MNSSRITWSSNSKAESTASPSAAASDTLATPMEEPEVGRLHEDGQAERRDRLLHHLGGPRRSAPPAATPRPGARGRAARTWRCPCPCRWRRRARRRRRRGRRSASRWPWITPSSPKGPWSDGEHDGAGRQGVVEVGERQRRIAGATGRRGRQRVDLADVGEDPAGVDPPLVVGQPDRLDGEPARRAPWRRCGAPRCTTPRARPTGRRRRPPALPDQASTEAIQSAARAMRAILHI